MLEKLQGGLFRRALKIAAEKGTDVQQNDVAGLIGQTASSAGELDDLRSGRRDPAKHAHHPIENLEESVQMGKQELRRLIADMEGR
jgi:hypothetical protein